MIVLITFAIVVLLRNAIAAEVLVETTNGVIAGTVEAGYQGREYQKFFGVPFAAPPVGSLR